MRWESRTESKNYLNSWQKFCKISVKDFWRINHNYFATWTDRFIYLTI